MPTAARRVLLVDDDHSVSEWIKGLLVERGHSVDTASDGKEALALLRLGPTPDAIIVELVMPVMSGWEFLDAKAADEKFRAVPVLVLTAHEHAPVHLKHVVGLFRKPEDVSRMIDALDGDLTGKAHA